MLTLEHESGRSDWQNANGEQAMKLVVVGGHSRNIGKTSLVANLISGLPQIRWTAVKITQYGHGMCSVNGRECQCAADEHRYAITEEKNRDGKGDTCRFLRAGAHHSLWVRTKQGGLAEAMPSLMARIARQSHVIIESNSLLDFVNPDLYLMVLDGNVVDFKSSAREHFHRASAYVFVDRAPAASIWKSIPLELAAKKPRFIVRRGEYISPALLEFVSSALGLLLSPWTVARH